VAGCTQTLITYLATHGYDRPLSPKLLSSNKEFGAVVAFLARRIDPGAAPLTGRVEEEVPALFKRLRYPFSIPKSALQAVGSPHTWPALVAALAWLVELLQYEEHASKATSSVFDAGCGAATTAARADAGAVEQSALGGERAFFDFCAASYGAYISGDDAAVAALDEQLEAQYARHDDALAAAVERLGGENAGLEERLVAARASLVATADLHAQKARCLSTSHTHAPTPLTRYRCRVRLTHTHTHPYLHGNRLSTRRMQRSWGHSSRSCRRTSRRCNAKRLSGALRWRAAKRSWRQHARTTTAWRRRSRASASPPLTWRA
jgi:hypothetical protein